MQGYHARLNVTFGADRDTIDKNYKKLARKYHPDKNPSKTAVEEFQKIATACAFCLMRVRLSQSGLHELCSVWTLT